MIQNKKYVFIAVSLYIVSIVLNFPFPHVNPYGEVVASRWNVPVRSEYGLHYVGITALLFFIASLFFLSKSLRKYKGRIILLAFLFAPAFPALLANAYQQTIATDIYAISYERNLSKCNFDMVDETTLRGMCEFTFENYSKHDVAFSIDFYENYPFEDDSTKKVSLMRYNSPYNVKLKGKEQKQVTIEALIDITNVENHVETGSSSHVGIIMKSGERVRNL